MGYPEQLSAVLARAQKAPFYRDRLSAHFEENGLTRKRDLREHSPWGFLAVPRTKLVSYHESSGSSGEPTSSFFTEADWDDVVTRFLRNAVKLRNEDTVLIKTPYSLLTTAHQMHRAAERRGALIVPADNRCTNMPYAKVTGLLRRTEVTVTWSLPTELLLWAEAAKYQDLDPKRHFPNLRALVVAGEALSPAKKARLASLWGGKPVYEDYGSTETGSLGGQCEAGQLHLWSDRIYFEVYDRKQKKFSRFGRGQLVVTPLFRQAMPLVRYCLEDEVEILPSPCLCGEKTSLARVFGRSGSEVTVQGKRFLPVELEEAVFSLSECHQVNFFRARYSDGDLQIEAQGASAAACRELENIIQQQLLVKSSVHSTAQAIVPDSLFVSEKPFLKPRFLFAAQENWNEAIIYS